MKYNETKLTYADFIEMLKSQYNDFDSDSESSSLREISSACLTTDFENFPAFYYFDDIDGKQYVLEENENHNSSLIYEVSDVGADTAPCEYILRETVGSWDGDYAENLVIYGLDPQIPNADESETNVKVWVSFDYSSTLGAPLDRYVRGVDVNEESDDYDAYEFATYKDAQEWINKQESERYVLAHNEIDRPDYKIV